MCSTQQKDKKKKKKKIHQLADQLHFVQVSPCYSKLCLQVRACRARLPVCLFIASPASHHCCSNNPEARKLPHYQKKVSDHWACNISPTSGHMTSPPPGPDCTSQQTTPSIRTGHMIPIPTRLHYSVFKPDPRALPSQLGQSPTRKTKKTTLGYPPSRLTWPLVLPASPERSTATSSALHSSSSSFINHCTTDSVAGTDIPAYYSLTLLFACPPWLASSFIRAAATRLV